MDEKVLKYLSDINVCISQIDAALLRFGRNYEVFESDIVLRLFVERNIEIMGEAMGRILKIHPDIAISKARKIVDTRNFVIHAYDSLKPEILWAIVINHLPILKQEVISLLGNVSDDNTER